MRDTYTFTAIMLKGCAKLCKSAFHLSLAQHVQREHTTECDSDRMPRSAASTDLIKLSLWCRSSPQPHPRSTEQTGAVTINLRSLHQRERRRCHRSTVTGGRLTRAGISARRYIDNTLELCFLMNKSVSQTAALILQQEPIPNPVMLL